MRTRWVRHLSQNALRSTLIWRFNGNRARHLPHEADGWWAESPDVEGWSATGDSYAEVVKLAEKGIPFALENPAELEHYVPLASTSQLDPTQR